MIARKTALRIEQVQSRGVGKTQLPRVKTTIMSFTQGTWQSKAWPAGRYTALSLFLTSYCRVYIFCEASSMRMCWVYDIVERVFLFCGGVSIAAEGFSFVSTELLLFSAFLAFLASTFSSCLHAPGSPRYGRSCVTCHAQLIAKRNHHHTGVIHHFYEAP